MFFKSQPGAFHRRLRTTAQRAHQQEAAVDATAAFPIPDLLNREPYLSVDGKALLDLLDLGFLGKDLGSEFDEALAKAQVESTGWNSSFFSADLFVEDFTRTCSQLTIDGTLYPANRPFLTKVLSNVPTDRETVEMRQGILIELDGNEKLNRSFHDLYRSLYALLSLFETPGYQGSLDTATIHLEILSQSKSIVDRMTDDFRTAQSGLQRLHRAGHAIRQTEEYRTLASLLDYEENMAELALQVRIGGDGKIRRVLVEGIEENGDNPFRNNRWRRLMNRLKLLAGGYDFTTKELMKRVIDEVFDQLSPSLIPLIQLQGHLEFYLASLQFKRESARRGLEVCLPELCDRTQIKLEGLFNPLLLSQPDPPVPCNLETASAEAITLITGPNSGGKTRLLQAIGWAQLLGQSGVYAPAARARLPIVNGLFVSLVENESAHQTEGRLGRELIRIRSLFEEIEPASMVILDELCSGTNPSEGVEMFALVLKLLGEVEPLAFVTTHFLDFTRSLEKAPPVAALEFLQVCLDEEQVSTYQFKSGVAPTSLATLVAARLGVTFERLSAILSERSKKDSVDDIEATVAD